MLLSQMTAQQVASLSWTVVPEPLIGAPFPSPIIADPTFLGPGSTPEGDWRMWAHR